MTVEERNRQRYENMWRIWGQPSYSARLGKLVDALVSGDDDEAEYQWERVQNTRRVILSQNLV